MEKIPQFYPPLGALVSRALCGRERVNPKERIY
jgi:hypothetical protein